jgi:hypothetical protein
MSIVASVIKHHLMIEGAMSPSYPDERSDYAQDNMSHEDYRDATEGRCGFPWDDDNEVAGDAERQLNNHLATIAIHMVFALTQADWSDVGEQNDWVQFLGKCFGNGFATEFVMSSWDDDGFSLY